MLIRLKKNPCFIFIPDQKHIQSQQQVAIFNVNFAYAVAQLAHDEVFISHPHFDHIGGFSTFLNENNKVKIYVPISLRGIRNAKEIIYVDKPVKLHDNVFSTGELDHIEQSMAVKTDKGLILIVRCSHPKIYRRWSWENHRNLNTAKFKSAPVTFARCIFDFRTSINIPVYFQFHNLLRYQIVIQH